MPSSDQSDCTSRPSESRSRARERQRPRRVHARAERREDADAPVADLVAEALDDDGAVRRHGAGRVLLLAEEREQVAAARSSSEYSSREPRERLRLAQRDELARRLADRLAQLVRPADALALPERDRARDARRRRDEHPVARDLLDAPRRGAEQERLAGARLVDHLLVELADAAAAVDEVDAEQAAIRDRAGVRHREAANALRPRMTPAVRSQMMRGRSSANSSDG